MKMVIGRVCLAVAVTGGKFWMGSYDADDFHLPENVTRMVNGIPLDDSDSIRWPASLAN